MTRKSILFQRYDRDFSWNSRIGKCAKRGAAEQCPPQYQKKGTNECQAPTIYEAVVTLQLIALPTTMGWDPFFSAIVIYFLSLPLFHILVLLLKKGAC